MIDFWKDYDGTNSDSIPHLRVDVNKPSWWHGSWEYSGLDVERIKAYCKATGKEYEKQAINAKFMNEMEDWYLRIAEQYPALDKIKVEIKAMFPPSGDWMYGEGHTEEHTVCEVLSDVLWIIDKYKAEREDK